MEWVEINAPKAIVEGVLLALEDFPNVEIQLYGQRTNNGTIFKTS